MSTGQDSQGGVQSLLASFSEDSDPRVRTSALQALVSEKQIFILLYERLFNFSVRLSDFGDSVHSTEFRK